MNNAQAPVRAVLATPPSAPAVEEILVAALDLPVGRALGEADITWQKWPQANVLPGMITRRQSEDVRGAFVRQPIVAGDPIRREKLLRTGRLSSYLAATLQPGLRAVAIPIDPQGLSSAGGFIQPNDRVDVVKIMRDEEGRGFDSQNVQTILLNARVLAIGQNVVERAASATTATLEVTPEQSEMLILAQRNGQLTLVLRPSAEDEAMAGRSVEREGISTIVRYGIVQGAR
jgi:pilus assembly protein CpaB